MNESSKIELSFDLNNFNRPQEYAGAGAWAMQIVQLCMYDKGTFPSNPEIGIGMKKYDFGLEDYRYKLQSAINEQVTRFFPDMPFNYCTVDAVEDAATNSLILYLYISFNGTSNIETVVVAAKKERNYIKFAVSM